MPLVGPASARGVAVQRRKGVAERPLAETSPFKAIRLAALPRRRQEALPPDPSPPTRMAVPHGVWVRSLPLETCLGSLRWAKSCVPALKPVPICPPMCYLNIRYGMARLAGTVVVNMMHACHTTHPCQAHARHVLLLLRCRCTQASRERGLSKRAGSAGRLQAAGVEAARGSAAFNPLGGGRDRIKS